MRTPTPVKPPAADGVGMPVAVIALAVSMFAIGTTEFVIVGLLPTIAGDLHVSISTIGLVVTAYALGIAVGGPLITAWTARVPRKRLLLGLMTLFAAGNVACGLAPSFGVLLVARVATSFSHAAFASAGIVLAISLVEERRQGSAIAVMFGGLTIALAIGIPLGTLVGEHLGWRTSFYAVALLGTIALIADAILLPEAAAARAVPLRRQVSEIANRRVVVALMTTTIGFGGQIVAYTYVTPFLEDVSGFRPGSISLLLVAFGIAAAVGTFVAGPAVDRYPRSLPTIGLAGLAAVLALMTLTGETRIGATITLIAWGATSFGIGPILQHQATRSAPRNPEIVSALNISAFNLGIAGGAFLGGRVVASSGVHAVTWVGAVVVSLSVALASINALSSRRTRPAVA